LKHLSLKELKQRLILLDGKLLWLEKQSELELITSEETDDMIDLEMEMLEMGLELDSAEEVKTSHSGAPGVVDLEQMKETIHQQETFRESIMNLVQEIEEDPIEEPVEDLMSKFLLYDLRAFLEKAVNKVFTLEGKINQLKANKVEQKEIDDLHQEQKRATQSYLKDIIKKLKKEKPKMILSEKKIGQFKKLTNEQVAELKAQEEEQFDEMVEDLLK
jgi:transketolase